VNNEAVRRLVNFRSVQALSDADSMVLRDERRRGLQGKTWRQDATEQGDSRAGGESLPARTARVARRLRSVRRTTAIGGGKASKGRTCIAGITQVKNFGFELACETTMNPRVASRCNSADRIDEE
jgi:hypothetical protein